MLHLKALHLRERFLIAAKRTDVEGSSDTASGNEVSTSLSSLGPRQFFPGEPNWWFAFAVLHPGHLPFRDDIKTKLNDRIITDLMK